MKKIEKFESIFGEDFSNEEETTNGIEKLKIEELIAFKNHPFKLYTGERLNEMVESIRQFGVIVPIVVRKKKLRYEILSGHNRVEACRILEIKNVPAIIKEGLTEEEALLIVTETNLNQRSFSDLSHSERATVIAVRHEAMKKQGIRTDLLAIIEKLSKSPNDALELTSCQVGKRLDAREKIVKEFSISPRNISRYLRISKLSNSFKELIDDGEIAFNAGVDLSYIGESGLDIIHAIITEDHYKIDMKKATFLKNADKREPLTFKVANEIIKAEKRDRNKKDKAPKYWNGVFNQYFKKNQKEKEVKTIIDKALAMYFKASEKLIDEENEENEELEN
jgi:ParB family chromosome partitioning protein